MGSDDDLLAKLYQHYDDPNCFSWKEKERLKTMDIPLVEGMFGTDLYGITRRLLMSKYEFIPNRLFTENSKAYIFEAIERNDMEFFLLLLPDAHEALCLYITTAGSGRKDMLQHLFDSKRHFDITNYNNACEVAAANGHLECLQLLVKNNYPMGKHTAMKAAINGHEECFHFAMKHGGTCTKEQIEYWARYYIMLGPFDKLLNMCRILSNSMSMEMVYSWAAEHRKLDEFKTAVSNKTLQ
jgi:hypothetical protein